MSKKVFASMANIANLLIFILISISYNPWHINCSLPIITCVLVQGVING